MADRGDAAGQDDDAPHLVLLLRLGEVMALLALLAESQDVHPHWQLAVATVAALGAAPATLRPRHPEAGLVVTAAAVLAAAAGVDLASRGHARPLYLPLVLLALGGLAWLAARHSRRERAALQVRGAERERGRVARDLHDGLAQELAGMRTHLLLALRGGDPQALRVAAATATDHLEAQVEEVRRLITVLRPPALDRMGLVGALQALAERPWGSSAEPRAGVPRPVEVELQVVTTSSYDSARHERGRLPLTVAETTYRVVQEAVTNAVVHGGASTVRVELHEARGHLEVTVVDDGSGFDPSTARSGFGLQGQRERAALLGGSLRVSSEPGDGARVQLRAPLTASAGRRRGWRRGAGAQGRGSRRWRRGARRPRPARRLCSRSAGSPQTRGRCPQTPADPARRSLLAAHAAPLATSRGRTSWLDVSHRTHDRSCRR